MLRLAIEPDEPTAAHPAGWAGLLHALLGPRGARAAVAAAGVLALSLLLVSDLHGRLGAWVHDRPEYAWTLDEIALDPAPPGWLRAGRAGLLAAASEPLRGPQGRSSLDLDLGAVERAFKNVRWVERVRSVRRSYPDRVAVALDYRRPVAVARVREPDGPGTVADRSYLVDGAGVILARLPSDPDLDPDALPELVVLHSLSPPADGTPGTTWARPPAGDGPAEPDRAAIAAASLAGFLSERAEADGWPTTPDGSALRIHQVHLIDGDARRLMLALRRPGGFLWICWEEAPGRESPGRPSAGQKWRMLRDWAAAGEPPIPPQEGAFVFTPGGLAWRLAEGG